MGRSKPLLPWGDRPLIAWEVDELVRSSVDDFVVVTGARSEAVRRALGDGARYCVFNRRWPHGRAGSLALGARTLSARGVPEAVVIQNVDQPTRADIIDRLIAERAALDAEIVQPSYEDRGCHPIVLSGRLLPELAEVSEETLGLRAVMERHHPHRVPMDDEPVVTLDLDTPDTLDEGRRLLHVVPASG
jgi:molybdenum cofactor cytidylyltransferase